jgi:hypothetical protein
VRVVLLVTHVGEGGIARHTTGRVVLLVTLGGEDGIVGDTRRGGWHCW